MAANPHELVATSSRHTTFYLAAGARGVPIVFLHGWPELSRTWRRQLHVFGALGFRAVAPDLRGYGRSSIYERHEDYRLELAVADMLELLDALGAEKAVWVGHDWGAPSPGASSNTTRSGATALRRSPCPMSRRASHRRI